jgi:hypothetical protein
VGSKVHFIRPALPADPLWYALLYPPALNAHKEFLNELSRDLVQIRLFEAILLPATVGRPSLRCPLVHAPVVALTPKALAANVFRGPVVYICPDRSRFLIRFSVLYVV